jgi:prolyl-tRNA synthetase
VGGGGAIELVPVIEIGNIFKLGTKYSEPLDARYLDGDGQEQVIVMGSYGIGPARVAMAAIEQGHDDDGIIWPAGIAPFDVHIVLIGDPADPQGIYARDLWTELSDLGLDVLLDDRPGLRPGEKFAEADLLGCPLRVTVGKRTLPDGPLEVQERRSREKREIPLEGAAAVIRALWLGLADG